MAIERKRKADFDLPPNPGVEVGDEVFFQHPESGPMSGKVLAHGKHGAVIHAGNQRHRVRWSDVRGHKARSEMKARIVDHGDDGAILEMADGTRRFVNGKFGELMNESFEKSLAGRSVVFFKSHVKAYTRKDGAFVAEHDDKRQKKVEPAKKSKFGPHNVEAGHRVKYQAGDHAGEGDVVAAGKDGATVKDGSGREHAVHWHEVQGHAGKGGDKGGDKAPSQEKRAGDVEPLFSEAEIAKLPKSAAQPVKTKEELYQKSAEALEQFKAMLNPLAEKLGLESGKKMDDVDWGGEGHYLFIAPLKGEERAAEKVESDYGGDWSKLLDVVRGSIAVDTHEQIREVVGKLTEAGLKLAKQPKDRFHKPTPVGYRDLLMNVELPNGIVGELQLHVKGMLEAKEQGHKPYEVMRSLFAKHGEGSSLADWPDEDQQSFMDAESQSKDIYNNAWANMSNTTKSQENTGKSGGEELHKSLAAGIIPIVLWRKAK